MLTAVFRNKNGHQALLLALGEAGASVELEKDDIAILHSVRLQAHELACVMLTTSTCLALLTVLARGLTGV